MATNCMKTDTKPCQFTNLEGLEEFTLQIMSSSDVGMIYNTNSIQAPMIILLMLYGPAN